MAREKVVMVRLGDIEERRDLNPRERLSMAAVQEYVRRLQNGETPPPLIVHEEKMVLFAGAHRMHAYKDFYGDGWEDQKVPTILRGDLPDPDEDPDLFRLAAAEENKNNGVPVTRSDKQRLLVDALKARGEEIVFQWAAALGETKESVQELLAKFRVPDTLPEAGAENTRVSAVGGAATPRKRVPVPGAVRYRPESVPVGLHRSLSPAIRVACRKMREALADRKELSEREREELHGVRVLIDEALGQAGEGAA